MPGSITSDLVNSGDADGREEGRDMAPWREDGPDEEAGELEYEDEIEREGEAELREAVGTRRPRDFLVKFGTGIGIGREEEPVDPGGAPSPEEPYGAYAVTDGGGAEERERRKRVRVAVGSGLSAAVEKE